LKRISAVFEGNRNIYWRLTVRENIEFFSALKGVDPKKIKDEINYYIDSFALKDKENEMAKNLSRGMQQKLAIAVAMVSQSDVIVLDEPTLGLDIKTSFEIRGLLKKLSEEDGRTILLTTHDMNVAQDICDRVIIINKGKMIANDRIENLMQYSNNENSFERVFMDIIGRSENNEKQNSAV
jgi:ABC-2 type transport system ATP-binding protein